VRRPILSMQAKTTYVLLGVSAVLFVLLVSSFLTRSVIATSVVFLAAFWAWILIGARRFRGDDEPAELPRAWWRFTARPKAGLVLAVLLGVVAAFELFGPLITDGSQPANPITAITFGVPAIAYLHSSLRLLGPRT
jgi:uncharacterized membrane protein YhaH (DUF805 family)